MNKESRKQYNVKIFFISKDANWQNYRKEVFEYLANKYSCEIHILTTGRLKDYLLPSNIVKYHVFSSFFPERLTINFFPGALVWIVKEKPDIILGLNNISNLTEYCALFLSKLIRIPFVWWTHGFHHGSTKSLLLRVSKEKYWTLFLKFGTAIITYSHKGKEYLQDQGINKDKIFVAPNTLNTNLRLKMDSTLNHQEILPPDIADNEDLILLFCGRISRRKKLENVIHALSRLRAQGIRMTLLVVGDGDSKARVSKLGNGLIPGQIILYGSIFDERKLARIFRTADLFVMPGTVGLAIVHAFCFGLPLITERHDMHSPEIQYLEHGENGFFLKENDIDEWVNILSLLNRNREWLELLSKRAKHTAETECHIDNMIDSMYRCLVYATSKN